MSQRKELDWQSQYEALSNARRIIHNHASVMLPVIHPFVLAAAPVIDSLRSIPARLAITVFQVGSPGATCASCMQVFSASTTA